MTETPETELRPQEGRTGGRRKRRWLPILIVVAVGVVVVGLVWNLFSGSLFFYNADEAVERRDELGDDRFTLQGSPVDCGITGFVGDEPVVAFSVTHGGAAVDVIHVGDPAELFQPGVPVVLDGAWVASPVDVDGFAPRADDGWHFASDRMRVKHDEDYRNSDEYDERLDEASDQVPIGAEAASTACSP